MREKLQIFDMTHSFKEKMNDYFQFVVKFTKNKNVNVDAEKAIIMKFLTYL